MNPMYKYIKPRKNEVTIEMGEYSINTNMENSRGLIFKNVLEELIQFATSLDYKIIECYYDYNTAWKKPIRSFVIKIGKNKSENHWYYNSLELIFYLDRYNRLNGGYHILYDVPEFKRAGSWIQDSFYSVDSDEFINRLIKQFGEMKSLLKQYAYKYILVVKQDEQMLYKVIDDTYHQYTAVDEFTGSFGGPISPFQISKKENEVYELLEEEYKLFDKYFDFDWPKEQEFLLYNVIYKRLGIKTVYK